MKRPNTHDKKTQGNRADYVYVFFSVKSKGGDNTNNRKGNFKQDFLYLTVRQVSQQQPSRSQSHLKLLELLLGSSSLCHFEDVEPHGLAQRSALSDGDNVSNCDVSAENHHNKDRLTGCWVPLSKTMFS